MSSDLLSRISSNFGAVDWAIVGLYMLGTVAIGLYANRYIRNMSDYIVAGRSLKPYLAVATMIGSELGLVTVMYSAQQGLHRRIRRSTLSRIFNTFPEQPNSGLDEKVAGFFGARAGARFVSASGLFSGKANVTHPAAIGVADNKRVREG
jgi:hypothetical protein